MSRGTRPGRGRGISLSRGVRRRPPGPTSRPPSVLPMRRHRALATVPCSHGQLDRAPAGRKICARVPRLRPSPRVSADAASAQRSRFRVGARGPRRRAHWHRISTASSTRRDAASRGFTAGGRAPGTQSSGVHRRGDAGSRRIPAPGCLSGGRRAARRVERRRAPRGRDLQAILGRRGKKCRYECLDREKRIAEASDPPPCRAGTNRTRRRRLPARRQARMLADGT
jgi:hypothetical protein